MDFAVAGSGQSSWQAVPTAMPRTMPTMMMVVSRCERMAPLRRSGPDRPGASGNANLLCTRAERPGPADSAAGPTRSAPPLGRGQHRVPHGGRLLVERFQEPADGAARVV